MEQRDFFVSYAGANEAWAVRIARILTSNGYSVYYQKDILPGDNFLECMEQFLEHSRNFLAVWSKQYSDSGYCMAELRGAFHEYTQGRMDRILLVRAENFRVTPLYAALVHIDLFGVDNQEESVLIDAVRSAVPQSSPDTEDDESEVLYQLGKRYYFGEGVAKDYAKAWQYWEQAAKSGHTGALYRLGNSCFFGRGVEKDYTKARQYYEQAAEKNNQYALYRLGDLYYYGWGVTEDYAKAKQCWEQAATKDHAKALYSLGNLYYSGKGVTKDNKKALEYYQRAADLGDSLAQEFAERIRKAISS